MYICYMKHKDSIIAQNSNVSFEIFDNTDNINLVLKTKNNIETIDKKINELEQPSENIENENIKKLYLLKKKNLEETNLEKLIKESKKTYSEKKEIEYVRNIDFIEDLNNKLNLIDLYLEIRNSIINHEELNISFNNKENQSKKLKFISLCFSNVNNPEFFIDSLIEKDDIYSINKQKN